MRLAFLRSLLSFSFLETRSWGGFNPSELEIDPPKTDEERLEASVVLAEDRPMRPSCRHVQAEWKALERALERRPDVNADFAARLDRMTKLYAKPDAEGSLSEPEWAVAQARVDAREAFAPFHAHAYVLAARALRSIKSGQKSADAAVSEKLVSILRDVHCNVLTSSKETDTSDRVVQKMVFAAAVLDQASARRGEKSIIDTAERVLASGHMELQRRGEIALLPDACDPRTLALKDLLRNPSLSLERAMRHATLTQLLMSASATPAQQLDQLAWVSRHAFDPNLSETPTQRMLFAVADFKAQSLLNSSEARADASIMKGLSEALDGFVKADHAGPSSFARALSLRADAISACRMAEENASHSMTTFNLAPADAVMTSPTASAQKLMAKPASVLSSLTLFVAESSSRLTRSVAQHLKGAFAVCVTSAVLATAKPVMPKETKRAAALEPAC